MEISIATLIFSPCRILLPSYQYFRKERETFCSCRSNLEGLKIYPVLSKAFSRCWNPLNHRWVTCTASLSHGRKWNEDPGNYSCADLLSGSASNSNHSGPCDLPRTAQNTSLGCKSDIISPAFFSLVRKWSQAHSWSSSVTMTVLHQALNLG